MSALHFMAQHIQIKFSGEDKRAAKTSPRWWIRQRSKYLPNVGKKQLLKEINR